MLKKDIIGMCILHLIGQKEIYGYELLRQLHSTFPDTKESAVYALIRELHKTECIAPSVKRTAGGPPRTYYQLTEKGAGKLEDLLSEWHRLQNELQKIGIF